MCLKYYKKLLHIIIVHTLELLMKREAICVIQVKRGETGLCARLAS